MGLSSRAYNLGTRIAAIVAVASVFAMGHVPAAAQPYLLAAMIASASLSIFLMFGTNAPEPSHAIEDSAPKQPSLALDMPLTEPVQTEQVAEADLRLDLDVSAYIQQIQLAFDAREQQLAQWQPYITLAGANYWTIGTQPDAEKETLNKVLYLVHNMRAPNYELVLKSNNEIVIRRTVGERQAQVEREPAVANIGAASGIAEWVH